MNKKFRFFNPCEDLPMKGENQKEEGKTVDESTWNHTITSSHLIKKVFEKII